MKNIQEKIASKDKCYSWLKNKFPIKFVSMAMMVSAVIAYCAKSTFWELPVIFSLIIYLTERMIARFCLQLDCCCDYKGLGEIKTTLHFYFMMIVLSIMCCLSIYLTIKSRDFLNAGYLKLCSLSTLFALCSMMTNLYAHAKSIVKNR